MDSISSRAGDEQEDDQSDLPIAYAPKWVRASAGQPPVAGQATASGKPVAAADARAGGPAPWQAAPGSRIPHLLPQSWLSKSAPQSSGDDAAARNRLVRRSLQPVPVPEPPEEDEEGGSAVGLWIAAGVTIAAAATVAFVVVTMLFPAAHDKRTARNDRDVPTTSPAVPGASPAVPGASPAASAFAAAPGGDVRPDPSMPAWVTAATTGLSPTAASPGTPSAPAAAVVAAVPAVAPAPPEQDNRQPAAAGALLDPEEIEVLTKRGETLLKTGNVAAARLVLQWPAEVGDARAALALGSTFDPSVLKQLRVVGSAPDVTQARAWYDKAATLGSAEASRRLRSLPR